jgi:hypothetical protein
MQVIVVVSCEIGWVIALGGAGDPEKELAQGVILLRLLSVTWHGVQGHTVLRAGRQFHGLVRHKDSTV